MTPTTGSNFRICTLDQQVDDSFMDDACHESENLCLQNMTSDTDKEHFIHEMDSFCLHRKNIYVGKMKSFCNYFFAEHPYYGKSYFDFGKQFFD